MNCKNCGKILTMGQTKIFPFCNKECRKIYRKSPEAKAIHKHNRKMRKLRFAQQEKIINSMGSTFDNNSCQNDGGDLHFIVE